jgi:ferritin-like metal-binding protein YciE
MEEQMKLDSLHALYIEQLQDLYSAEQQLTKALPKMAKAAHSPKLKAAFEGHLEQTKTHIERLEQIFKSLNTKHGNITCKGMQGLIEEGDEMIKEKADPDVKDAGLIAAAQRVEHYEMAGYGTVRTYAQVMGHKEHIKLLQQTLDEEGAADKKLTSLAESGINVEAASGN